MRENKNPAIVKPVIIFKEAYINDCKVHARRLTV